MQVNLMMVAARRSWRVLDAVVPVPNKIYHGSIIIHIIIVIYQTNHPLIF